MRRYTLNQIRALSDEEIRSMSKEETLKALTEAYTYARERRKEVLDWYDKHPDVPLPQILRKSPNRVNGDWQEFNMSVTKEVKNLPIGTLKGRLTDIIGFLSAKTLNIRNWQSTLRKFTEEVIKKAKPISEKTGKRLKLKDLDRKTYSKFWKIYSRISELKVPNVTLSSTQMQTMIYETMSQYKTMSINDLIETIGDRLGVLEEATAARQFQEMEEASKMLGITFTRTILK